MDFLLLVHVFVFHPALEPAVDPQRLILQCGFRAVRGGLLSVLDAAVGTDGS